ncbi:MAG: patatin-like phospholipase family protein [Methylocystis sp.]
MSELNPERKKPVRLKSRPPFEQIALLLQGGGALGSYQGGVYQALDEANIRPDWVAGVSIGAINSAIIVGNPPEKRVKALRDFWQEISWPFPGPFGVPLYASELDLPSMMHAALNRARAFGVMLLGAPGFFTPRFPSPVLAPTSDFSKLSFYDTNPLRSTLERIVDFDRINAGDTRLTVGTTNVQTGNLTCFDNQTGKITPAHIIASGSLPPGFPATEIDGEYYWDGGLVSNTPLQFVLDSEPRRDTLAFQVDLWSARGPLPADLEGVDVREREIRYSSRTRAGTDQYKLAQRLRIAFSELLPHIPQELRETPGVKLLADAADDKVCNIVHLIYKTKNYEGNAKDYEFSRETMDERWSAGYADTVRALSHPEALTPPDKSEGVRTLDFNEGFHFE